MVPSHNALTMRVNEQLKDRTPAVVLKKLSTVIVAISLTSNATIEK